MPLARPGMLVLLCALALVAPSGQAQHCTTTDTDKAAVTAAMRTLYAGATIDDMAKMHSVTAPNFSAFDGGTAYSSIDDLMKIVKAQQDQGMKYVWSVTKPRVTIHCNDAWIAYVNDGSVQRPNSAATPAQWLESAILEKRGGIWKIVFFHSTLVRPAKPAQ